MSPCSRRSSEFKAAAAATATMDEKKRKRMQSNRESAKRSRLKRERLVKDLVNEIATLKEQVLEFNRQYNDMTQRTHNLLSENESLNLEKAKLGEYLNSLYSVYMRFTQTVQTGCLSNQKWQVHNKMHPIITTGMPKSQFLFFRSNCVHNALHGEFRFRI